MSYSKKLLFFCLSFVSGIFLESFLKFPRLFAPVFLIFGIILACSFFERKKIFFLAFCFVFLSLGMIRLQHDFNFNLRVNYFTNGISYLRNTLEKSIDENFSYEQAQVLDGMILGDNSAISWEMKKDLNVSGLRHIIAVSGSHIVIFGSILMSLFLGIGLWRRQAILSTLLFLFIFLAMTGFPSSGIRAGIMGGAAFVGMLFGRKAMSFRFLVFSCAIMLAFSPALLEKDLGFRLSFAATGGIIFFNRYFINLFSFFPKKINFLRDILATTFSAQVFSIPIMVFDFGTVSWIAPISNILVLPIVYWIMIFGFISALSGIFLGFLGQILSLPCRILLDYFVFITKICSFSWMQWSFGKLHWFWLSLSYFSLGFWAYYVKKKEKLNFLE